LLRRRLLILRLRLLALWRLVGLLGRLLLLGKGEAAEG
jgi:hypothetical protein